MRCHPLFVAWLVPCVLVMAYLVALASSLGHRSDEDVAPPYSVGDVRRTGAVVLVVVDSLPVRTAEDPAIMPRLGSLMRRGAAGVLWASKHTGTQQGILGLATGTAGGGMESLRLFNKKSYAGWTIFEDIRSRGETQSFNGESKWVHLFGELGTRNHASHGGEGTFFDEDLAAVENAKAVLASPSRPALTVLHITEPDYAAHQHGTTSEAYRAILRRWDGILGDFVELALDGDTTVIVTSDHGNDIWGSHGGGGDIFRRVPVVMIGKAIRPVHGFAMSGVDMPATLAVLLGTRAPGDALARPATAPLDLLPDEEARVLLATHDHLVSLAERAGSPLGPEHRERAIEQHRLAASGRSGEAITAVQRSAMSLAEGLQPLGRLSPGSVGAALLALLGAAGLLFVGSGFARSRWAAALLILGLVVAEAGLIARFSFAAEIKHLVARLRAEATGPQLALCAAVVGLSIPGLVGRGRRWRWREEHLVAVLAVAFVVCSAWLPLGKTSLLFLCVLVACLRRERVPLRRSALIVLAFAGYFIVSTSLVWARLGESPPWRYGYALGAAALASVWLFRRPLRGLGAWPRVLLVSLLAFFPFSWLHLETGRAPLDAALAGLSLAGLAALVLRRGGSRLCVLALGVTGASLAFPSGPLLLGALAVLALLCVHLARPARREPATWLSLGALFVAALCAMSKPSDVPSVVALFAALLGCADLLDEQLPSSLAIGLWAAALASGRDGYFELFGRVDSPAPLYGFAHLDLAVGLQAGSNLDLALATSLVLLKMVLASLAVLSTVLVLPSGRALWRRVAVVAGSMMLIDLIHHILKLNLSKGALTDRFDEYLLSVTIHAALYGSMAIACLFLPSAPRSRPLGVSEMTRNPTQEAQASVMISPTRAPCERPLLGPPNLE